MPDAATDKAADCPASTVALPGWAVIDGATTSGPAGGVGGCGGIGAVGLADEQARDRPIATNVTASQERRSRR